MKNINCLNIFQRHHYIQSPHAQVSLLLLLIIAVQLFYNVRPIFLLKETIFHMEQNKWRTHGKCI